MRDITCPCCGGSGWHGPKWHASACDLCDGAGRVDPVWLADLGDDGWTPADICLHCPEEVPDGE